jgi:FkbM family methyltransferase
MINLFQELFFKSIIVFDKFIYLLFKKNFIYNFATFLNKELFTKKIVSNKNLILYTPSKLVKWRTDTMLTKEPGTLQWIDSFSQYTSKPIFWDIGANIGLYSIYAAINNLNAKVISFEPSPTNVGILTKNISFNNLEEKIYVCQNPITDKEFGYFKFVESSIESGNSMNSLISNQDNYPKKNKSKALNYYLSGNSLNFFIKNKILDIPNFIKIDVDGNEHEILEGAQIFLNNKEIVSILVEIDDNNQKNRDNIINLITKNGFELKNKDKLVNDSNSKFYETYNYIFFKK